MDLRTCPKGHRYNGDVDATCPVCAAEKQRESQGMAADYGATEPISGFGGGFSPAGPAEGFSGGFGAVPPTEPVGGSFGGGFGTSAPTEPVTGGFGTSASAEPAGNIFGNVFGNMFGATPPTEPVGGVDDFGKTEPIGGGAGFGREVSGTLPPSTPLSGNGETMRFCDMGFPGVDNYNDQTMPHSPGMVAGFTPVVGWLVCVDGPDRGHDYRIRSGYNYIGRAEHMDICIRGDKQVSREKHAIIAYDDTEKVFFFGPADGRNIVRVNGKMAMVPTELHAYDIVTVGTSKMIFIPLCGEKFDWNVPVR